MVKKEHDMTIHKKTQGKLRTPRANECFQDPSIASSARTASTASSARTASTASSARTASTASSTRTASSTLVGSTVLSVLVVIVLAVFGLVLLAASCTPVSVNEDLLRVSTYHNSVATDMLPVELGQAIVDEGMFSLENSDVVLTISNLMDGKHNLHFGLEAGDYSGIQSYEKMATGGAITILKSEVELANSFVPFGNGIVMGISGSDPTDIKHVATYFPSNIYNHRDLQAMRRNLTKDYVLKNDIVFPPVGAGTSNFEAIGTTDDMGTTDKPFRGSLNGAGYTITGVQIESTNNYQGLFGVMEASTADTAIANNLVLRDFKIKANAYVGSLAGWIRKGTINNVSVEVSSPDAGKVEIIDHTLIDTVKYGFGGGLVGRAAKTGTQDIQIKIQNTSSEVKVIGLGMYTDRIGGLAGEIGKNVVLTESYATGDVTGEGGAMGGLVGYNKGNVSGYANGLVRGSGDGIGGLVGGNEGSLSGYATGMVTGKNTVGGLVGINSTLTGHVTGYATGVVRGEDNIGGLVGANNSRATGYAIGPVTGRGDGIGGLAGTNRGTLIGYATGDVIGDMLVGGLVGMNGGTLSGYATGDARGNATTGGLIGSNYSSAVSGYARGVVRRSDGRSFLNFGKIVGLGDSRNMYVAYNSMSESKVYDGTTGTTTLTDMSGVNGTPVTVDGTTAQAVFTAGLTFGTDLGEWTWVGGKWPAINIGDEIKPASEQPINP